MRMRSGCFRSAVFYLSTILLVVALYDGTVVLAGESEWVEVKSPNFSVVTDAGEKRGREVAMRFEQMRSVFGTLMTKERLNLPIPLQIVAFRNTKEMRQVAPLFNGKPTQLAGLFQGGTDRDFIMLDLSVDNPWAVVFHEYAHQLMNGNLGVQFAPWFEEGFAEYFSTITVDGKQAEVGRIPDDTYVILRQAGMMRIADLLRVQQDSKTYNESGDHRNSFYAESGLLMHYIYDNQFMPKVAAYFELSVNKHVRIEDALQQAFGMSARQFDDALFVYARNGNYRFYRVTAPAAINPKDFVAAPLSTASGNAVLADIHLHSRDYREQAVTEFQDILKSDPRNSAACRGLGYAFLQKQDYAQATEYFKRASELDSKDPRVHYYSALLMSRESGMGGAANLAVMIRELETSISLDAGFADSYALLSFAQSASGDPAKAITTLQKALAISPRNEFYLFNLASLQLTNRQPDQAIALLQSLQASSNPAVASRATAALTQAQQFREMVNDGTAVYRPGTMVQAGENPETRDHAEDPTPPSPDVAAKVPANLSVAKFMRGTLTNVDCSTPPLATLTVVSGAKTWKMKIADKSHVILIGAAEFSCAWNKQKVALNYRETSESEGSVISVEIQ
jgi:tetratricopeptide (TPR) repeat protein